MAWPTTPIPTSNLDSGTDSPAAARPDLLAAVQAVNAMQTERLPAGQGGMPSGVVVPFAGAAAPTGWLLCYGQAVSRTTYADLFAAIGTAHGVGDGSTTFNLPDLRGRAPAGKDDMGGTSSGRLTVALTGTRASTSNGIISGLSSTAGLSVGMAASGAGVGTGAVVASIDSSTQVTLSVVNTATGTATITFSIVDGLTLGASGGSQVHTLTTPQMPAHTHSTGTIIGSRNTSAGGGETIVYAGATYASTSTGGGQAHPNLQPTIILNYIIKA